MTILVQVDIGLMKVAKLVLRYATHSSGRYSVAILLAQQLTINQSVTKK
jgi:hypothetical protein